MSDTASLSDFLVVVARDDAPDDRFSRHFASRGAQVVGLPLMTKEALDPSPALDAALKALYEFDCVAFASPAAVDFFIGRCLDLGILFKEELNRLCIAAVGKRSAKSLQRYGVTADIIGESGGFELGAQLNAWWAKKQDEVGTRKPLRVLLPRAAGGREELRDVLAQAGAQVVVVDVYRSRPLLTARDNCSHAMRSVELHRGPCALLLTSPKRAELLASLWSRPTSGFSEAAEQQQPSQPESSPRQTSELLWVAIGQTTGNAMRELGLEPLRVAKEPTPQAVLAALGI